MNYFNCHFLTKIQLNVEQGLLKCNEFRYSLGGRLVITSVLIIGLILVLWAVILFMGSACLSGSITVPSWVLSITSFTQNFLTSGITLLNLAIILVTVGIIVFLAMCLILPRVQNISPEKRIIL